VAKCKVKRAIEVLSENTEYRLSSTNTYAGRHETKVCNSQDQEPSEPGTNRKAVLCSEMCHDERGQTVGGCMNRSVPGDTPKSSARERYPCDKTNERRIQGIEENC